MPCEVHLTDFSISASSNTMEGLFPPSSRVTSFRFVSAEAFNILRPTKVLPVNAILRIPGCSLIACPTSSPVDMTGVSSVVNGIVDG